MHIIIFTFFILALMPPIHAMWEFDHCDGKHQSDLALIASSNTPIACASGITDCELCMRKAIKEYWERYVVYCGCFCRRKPASDELFLAACHAASDQNKINQLRELLEEFTLPTIDQEGSGNRSLLFHAIHERNVRAVNLLLAFGADPNQRGNKDYNYTPLMRAIFLAGLDRKSRADGITIIKLLLTYGARVNVRDNMRDQATQKTPLLLAEGDKEIVELLIDRGAYIDWDDHQLKPTSGRRDAFYETGGFTVFDHVHGQMKDQLTYYENKDIELYRDLLKKIVVEGSMAPLKIGKMSHRHCTPPTSHWALLSNAYKPICDLVPPLNTQCVHLELVLQRVLGIFNRFGLPREIQVKILSNLRMNVNLCSVSILAKFGNLITPEHCEYAVSYVPDYVFKSVVERLRKVEKLSPDKVATFIERMKEALVERKATRLCNFIKRKLKEAGVAAGTENRIIDLLEAELRDHFPQNPERPLSIAYGSSLDLIKLRSDIEAHYEKLLSNNELSII